MYRYEIFFTCQVRRWLRNLFLSEYIHTITAILQTMLSRKYLHNVITYIIMQYIVLYRLNHQRYAVTKMNNNESDKN